MEGITIKGRGWHQPQITTDCEDDCVRIRADDAQYEEIWVEVRISGHALGTLFERYLAHTEDITKSERDVLKRLIAVTIS